jgi:hypothetical protein
MEKFPTGNQIHSLLETELVYGHGFKKHLLGEKMLVFLLMIIS